MIYFFVKNIFLLTFSSILILSLSQLFLLIAYLLPLKILILLSMENMPDFLNSFFYNLNREEIILILSFAVFFMYGIHLLLERIVNVLINNSLKVLFSANVSFEKDVFSKKFIDNFFRLLSTLVLVLFLFGLVYYIFPVVAIGLLFYLLLIFIIFFSIKIEKKRIIKFFHISFFLGFIIIFIYEVIYLLYYDTKKIPIIVILVSIVGVRYIFLRGVFIINKLLVLYRDSNIFYKKFKDLESR